MTDVVLVHGIAHQQESADSIEARWLPSMAGGVRTAGFPEVADRLGLHAHPDRRFRCRVAFYGHLFTPPGRQGAASDELTPDERPLAEELARAWLERAAAHAATERDQQSAQVELQMLDTQSGQAQGLRAHVRSAIAALARLPWMGRFGLAFAERFLIRNLKQVTRYLTDDIVREQAQAAVLQLITPETRVVVGHSLGSVVAYEAIQRLSHPLPLLVTIGSPLGLGGAVYERLRPQPPNFPSQLLRWTNVSDRNDLVAAEPDLRPRFGSVPNHSSFEPSETVNLEGEPHNAEYYLTKPQVGRPIGESLQ